MCWAATLALAGGRPWGSFQNERWEAIERFHTLGFKEAFVDELSVDKGYEAFGMEEFG